LKQITITFFGGRRLIEPWDYNELWNEE
jgi:hypothetical protein